MTASTGRCSRLGSALLAVLWFSTALSAIAFTLSMTVRTEMDRAALNMDDARAYFLAHGAIEAAMMQLADRSSRGEFDGLSAFRPGQRFLRIVFPTGEVEVEIIGEAGKLDLNRAPPQALARVLAASGLDPAASLTMAFNIVDSRSGRSRSPDAASLSSFSSSRASFKQLEDLLMVPGIDPQVLYGTFIRNRMGQLVRVGGLYHHVTLWGSGAVDINYASIELLRAAGLSDSLVETIVRIRSQRPIDAQDGLLAGLANLNPDIRLGHAGTAQAYTLWATARVGRGRAKRLLGALVQQGSTNRGFRMHVTRWYDTGF